MKKISMFLALASFVIAQDAPPMPPQGPMGSQQEMSNLLPKECATIPPMLIFLPPPLESELFSCRNAASMPKENLAKESLEKIVGKNAKMVGIKSADGFSELYEVNYAVGAKNETIYCNKSMTKCIKPSKLLEAKSK